MAERTKRRPAGRICLLSEDELGLILNRLSDPDDRKSFSLVCKQWMRVEGATRLSIRLLRPQILRHVLPRFPNLVTFEMSKPIRNSDLAFLGHACPKIEVINLNLLKQISDLRGFGSKGLYYLGNGCPNLSKLSLRRRLGVTSDGVGWLLKKAINLRYLDLGECIFVTDKVLEAIGSWSSLTYLNLEGCGKITNRGLDFLANGSCSKTLKTLVLSR